MSDLEPHIDPEPSQQPTAGQRSLAVRILGRMVEGYMVIPTGMTAGRFLVGVYEHDGGGATRGLTGLALTALGSYLLVRSPRAPQPDNVAQQPEQHRSE